MLRFLFISSYDLRRNTSSNIRTIALMQALKKNGYYVDVAYIQSNAQIDEDFEDALTRGCENSFELISCPVYRHNSIKTNNDKSMSKIRQFLLKVYFKLFVYDVFQMNFRKISAKTLLSIPNDYDFIVSSSEPRSSHKLARIIIKKRKIGAKWIQYWGDPMTNDVASNKLFPFLEHKEEKKLLGSCDFAFYTNPGCARYMQRKYPFAISKIKWIPTSDIIRLREMLSCSNGTLLCYVGDYLSKYRNITPLYNVCNQIGYSLTIAGNSDLVFESTKFVSILKRVKRKKASEIENSSKILVVLDNERKDSDVCIQIPGKIYHYGLTNKYILVISNSLQLTSDYEKYKRFVFCKNNEDDIKASICQIMKNCFDDNYRKPLLDFSQDNVCELFVRTICSNK